MQQKTLIISLLFAFLLIISSVGVSADSYSQAAVFDFCFWSPDGDGYAASPSIVGEPFFLVQSNYYNKNFAPVSTVVDGVTYSQTPNIGVPGANCNDAAIWLNSQQSIINYPVESVGSSIPGTHPARWVKADVLYTDSLGNINVPKPPAKWVSATQSWIEYPFDCAEYTSDVQVYHPYYSVLSHPLLGNYPFTGTNLPLTSLAYYVHYGSTINESYYADGVDYTCDGVSWYTTMCAPDYDGDGFGNFSKAYNVTLKYSNQAWSVMSHNPSLICNFRDTSGDWFSLPSPFNYGDYVDANTGVYPGIPLDYFASVNYLDTQTSCEEVSYNWVGSPSVTTLTDFGSCSGTVACEEYNYSSCPTTEGCTTVTDYCMGTFSCSSLSSGMCASVEGCSVDSSGNCNIAPVDTRYGPDAGYDFNCTDYFMDSTSGCIAGAPTSCTSTNACVGAPLCSATSTPSACVTADRKGCDWTTLSQDVCTLSSGYSSGDCSALSSSQCASVSSCTWSAGTGSCSRAWSVTAPLQSTCDSYAVLYNSGTVDIGLTSSNAAWDHVGCMPAGIAAGCMNEVTAQSHSYGGQNYNILYPLRSGVSLSTQLNCVPIGGSSCYASNGFTSQTSCDFQGGCEWSVSPDSCSGTTSCTPLDFNTCTNVIGCENTYTQCEKETQMIAAIDEPRIDCNDGDARTRGCVCVADADNDGFFVLTHVPTYLEPDCPAGSDFYTGVLPMPVPTNASSIPLWNSTVGDNGRIWDADDNDPRETYIDCPSGQKFVYPETTLVQTWSSDDDYPGDLNNPVYAPKYFGGCCAGTECLQGDVGGLQLTVGVNNDAYCRSSSYEWNDTSAVNDTSVVCSPGDAVLGLPAGTSVNKWLDADSDQYVCEDILGLTWTQSGHTLNSTRANYWNTPFFTDTYDAEQLLNDKTRYECCGDDGGVGVTATCDGSSTSTPLCAPDNGKTYKISNGDLVEADSCPDIVRASPLWVQDSYIDDVPALDTQLQSANTGYCCTQGNAVDPAKPLCGTTGTMSDTGCFVAESSLNDTLPHTIAPNGVPSREWCDRTGPDHECVIDGSMMNDGTVCTLVNEYTQEAFASTALAVPVFTNPANPNNLGQLAVCRSYSYSSSATESYQTLSSSCNAATDTNGCTPIAVTSCTPPSLGNPTAPYVDLQESNLTHALGSPLSNPDNLDCVALCTQVSLPPNDAYESCVEYCSDYTCVSTTAYVGSACQITPGCAGQIDVTHSIIDEQPGALADCEAYPSSQNVADGFVYYNATSSNVYVGDLNVLIDPNNPGAGSVGIPQLTDVPEDTLFATLDGVLQSSGLNYPTSGSEEVLEYITTTVSANTYCATVTYDPGTLYCVPHGTVINSSGNDVVCGDLYNETNFGDYWCPDGFRFDFASDTCILEQNICDVGPVLTASCNPTLFTTPANDTYFNAYDSGCVEKSSSVPANLDVYDTTCCLAAVFNGVGLYQTNDAGSDPDHIKVY